MPFEPWRAKPTEYVVDADDWASSPSASDVERLPPRALATMRSPERPLRVMRLTTPFTASDPQTTLDGPRTTSTRSTLSVVSVDQSNEPPARFIGTPSTSTLV